jgi:isopenicillin N synthase-like dioxygenase
MISCNYYPKPTDCNAKKSYNKRLSQHKDVSLFSVFPFGLKDGFTYLNAKDEHISLGDQTTFFAFAGYLTEILSNKEVRALNHSVDLPLMNSERFSFAMFSIPKPTALIKTDKKEMTGGEYYQEYLNLF